MQNVGHQGLRPGAGQIPGGRLVQQPEQESEGSRGPLQTGALLRHPEGGLYQLVCDVRRPGAAGE